MPSSDKVLAAGSSVSQSDDEPMITPTSGLACNSLVLSCGGDFLSGISMVRSLKGDIDDEADILRCFTVCGDPRTIFPIGAQLADQVKRAADEDSVFRLNIG